MKSLSRKRVRELPPDALSSEKPGGAPGNARRHRRKIHRRTFLQHPGKIPPSRTSEASRPVLGSGNHQVLHGARRGAFTRLQWLSRPGQLQPPPLVTPPTPFPPPP